MKKPLYFLHRRVFLQRLILLLSIAIAGITLLQSDEFNTPSDSGQKNNSAEILKFSDLADSLYDAYKLDSSYYYYNKAKLLCNPKINTIDYVYTLYSMSQIKYDQGDYITSEAHATEALPYLKYIKNPRHASILYNQLGINYSNTYNYSDAILYLKKAIHLKSSTWRRYMALNNLATVYMDQHRYKEAEQILFILSTQKRTSNYEDIDKDNYARAIDNLGLCYFRLGDSEKALKYVNEALKIRLSLSSEYEYSLVGIYRHLCLFYMQTNPKLAKEYALKSHKVATKIKILTDRISSLSLLIKTSEGSDLKKYSLSYIKLIDSITHARCKTKNQFTNIKYISRIDKTENLQLKAQKAENDLELARQKRRNIYLYMIIVLILSLIAFVYFYLKSKGTKQKDDAVFESEIRISQKLKDELTNDVYHSLTFAETVDLEKRENKERLLNNLHAIYTKTRNISKENGSVPTNESYSNSLKEMISGFKTADLNIILNGFDAISWNELEKSKKIILYRILQELFVNMKKHSQATLVSLTFKNFEKKIVIIYSDNGVGAYNRSIILKNGLQNVENRIKTINGNIIFDSNSKTGFKLSFNFPK